MDKGRVGEESKGKEMDGCPLTERLFVLFLILALDFL
jgi:hypothetical protein